MFVLTPLRGGWEFSFHRFLPSLRSIFFILALKNLPFLVSCFFAGFFLLLFFFCFQFSSKIKSGLRICYSMWLSFKRQKEIKPNEKGVILEYPVLHNALAYLIVFVEQSI